MDIISLSLFSGAAHQVLQGLAKADVLRTCDSNFTDQCTSHIPNFMKPKSMGDANRRGKK